MDNSKNHNQVRDAGPGGAINLGPLAQTTFLILLSTLFVFALIKVRNFLFPLAFGALFSYLLYPVASFLEHRGLARILAILLSILMALVILASIFFLFYKQLANLFEDFDQLKSQVDSNIELLQNSLTNLLGLKDNSIEIFLKDQSSLIFGSEDGGIRKAFTATAGTIFRIVILPIYVFLFLFYRTKMAYFILKVVPEESKKTAIEILREISTVAARYLGGVSIVVLILCILNSTGLAIIGVEYAILFGIVSAFFNFIPYFGTLMGGFVPFLFVLTTTEDPLYYGLRVAIMYLIIQFTENYILTPNIVGGNVKINPMFIIIGLVAGAMVWGIPGMLVVVPFLAILKIIFSHIPRLKPYGFLLGLQGTSRHSISFRRIKNALHFRKKEE